MNLSFKAGFLKEWTLLDDRIILGKKEIMLTEIDSVKLFAKSSFANNGVIQITVNKKIITLAYPHKLREEGKIALEYLQDNCKYEEESYNKEASEEESHNRKTVKEIREEIEALPCRDEWGTRKEIAELPLILRKGEIIKAMTSGINDGNTWLIVCTNKRVLMLDKGMIYGLKLIDIPLDRINSISHSKGLIFGKIAITDGATTRMIENISKDTVSFFADIVNEQVELYKKNKNISKSQVLNNISPADELIKYKQLLDMGALTKEEFDKKKKELLGV